MTKRLAKRLFLLALILFFGAQSGTAFAAAAPLAPAFLEAEGEQADWEEEFATAPAAASWSRFKFAEFQRARLSFPPASLRPLDPPPKF